MLRYDMLVLVLQLSLSTSQHSRRPATHLCCTDLRCQQILREDVEAALAESTLAQERAALMTLEQQELQRQRDQLAGEEEEGAKADVFHSHACNISGHLLHARAGHRHTTNSAGELACTHAQIR
jgi:hypothetical protein